MKKLILSLAALIATVSATVGSAHEYNAKKYYITNTDSCHGIHDGRAKDNYYFGLYINTRKGDYNPDRDERVYLWVSRCPSRSEIESLGDKWIYLSLKESSLSPGNWDRDIENAESFDDLLGLVQGSQNKIVFEGLTSSSRKSIEPIVKVKIYGFHERNNNIISGIGERGTFRFTIDKRKNMLTYFNSKGQAAFEQSITADEVEYFDIALSQTQQKCSFELIIESKLRKIKKVKSSCVDLSTLELFDNFG